MKPFLTAVLAIAPWVAQADALEQLLRFQREIQSARMQFVQTVTSPDGKKARSNKGQFEFQRPNRFRFDYAAPQNQTLIGDGKKVWMIDPDLNQASSRPLDAVLSSTPVALLAGASLGDAFKLKNDGEQDGIAWVAATPKQTDAGIQSLRIGLRGRELALLEIVDGLGQRSRLVFAGFEANVSIAAERLRFTPSAGMDVIDTP
ncbi:outer membrane lipoprotein chaperone LolA [Inhella gelatinilytica]|uniref:Outer-membrane lipoprotein carrier protein n=1 Tax=Inhella gelatinilytica TaxID=2795030 RepID=A0A931IVW8_9BURK|nr:outer membrane lipoprotein chaperone LolA [Inhella gelatinilytica]MBH9553777.1 outer membrane lipoprotein chaperone LolA [Inhella gelatinilytica]